MKYIKTYEALGDDFKADINDILLEITDLGYTASMNNYGNTNIITIENHGRVIIFSEIKDCVLRLKYYLGDRYLGAKVLYSSRGNSVSGNYVVNKIYLNEKTEINGNITIFHVEYI